MIANTTQIERDFTTNTLSRILFDFLHVKLNYFKTSSLSSTSSPQDIQPPLSL
ncbi:hypothetical protein HMPREF0043_00435 [Actinobaculum sp. oral taxon 183 str. F0552]|nr:hypothetical protein HMPREF0043_00435 [Actinobaculum sp. oral taxon 183 str. F0552]